MKFLEPSEYQEKVATLYKQVKQDVYGLIPYARFEHIGASSISGSVSKGDLDIFVGVEKNKFDITIEKLKVAHFYEKENTLRTDELCMMITDRYNYDVAIQVAVNGSQFEDFIKFRNFMQSRPDLVLELNQLKRDCSGLSSDEYRKIKSKWVERIISQHLN